MADAYPLQWPIGRVRWSGARQPSAFKMSEAAMKEHLFTELERMNAKDIVVSTNQAPYSRAQKMTDPGVAVYFKRKGQELAIACDKYISVIDNLHAIGMAIEAFRMLERHGTGEMVDAAFSGFKALPEAIIMGAGQARAWHEVLQVNSNADASVIKAAYRNLAAKYHPDNQQTGDAAKFDEVRRAWEEVSGA